MSEQQWNQAACQFFAVPDRRGGIARVVGPGRHFSRGLLCGIGRQRPKIERLPTRGGCPAVFGDGAAASGAGPARRGPSQRCAGRIPDDDRPAGRPGVRVDGGRRLGRRGQGADHSQSVGAGGRGTGTRSTRCWTRWSRRRRIPSKPCCCGPKCSRRSRKSKRRGRCCKTIRERRNATPGGGSR